MRKHQMRPGTVACDRRPVAHNRPSSTTALTDLTDRYVDEMALLDPCQAEVMGIAGQEGRLTDFGPEAVQARAELARRTLRAIDETPVTDDTERISAAVLRERLATEVALADADAYSMLLDTIDGPVQRMRLAVGMLDQGSDSGRDALLSRLRALPGALTGLRESLEAARRRDLIAPVRQISRNARDCRDMQQYLTRLPAGYANGAFRGALHEVVANANDALTQFTAYLTEKLAADAPELDALGVDRYQLGVREFLGTKLDLKETYAWGWDELSRVRQDMAEAAAQIAPGDPVPAVLMALDNDPNYQVMGAEALRDWIQELADGAIADLDGTHFRIPEPLRRIDCRIASNNGPAYYLAPSEDLSRPGTVWWTLSDHNAPIPTWTVPSTMFHEGVPGHHLQLGMTALNNATLNRFQRLSSELHPGHCEGWGLYAERLMDELGYFADPAHRLGMLAGGQQMRAARVVLDIGLHLQLSIPAGTGFHDNERWTPQLAHEFLTKHCGLGPPGFVEFEIDRYLGRPGQAIAYKLGEKVWLEAREAVRRREGSAFDLKRFHHHALDLGPMGLDLLHTELTR